MNEMQLTNKTARINIHSVSRAGPPLFPSLLMQLPIPAIAQAESSDTCGITKRKYLSAHNVE